MAIYDENSTQHQSERCDNEVSDNRDKLDRLDRLDKLDDARKPRSYKAIVQRTLRHHKWSGKRKVRGYFLVLALNKHEAIRAAREIFYDRESGTFLQTTDERIDWESPAEPDEEYEDFSFMLKKVKRYRQLTS